MEKKQIQDGMVREIAKKEGNNKEVHNEHTPIPWLESVIHRNVVGRENIIPHEEHLFLPDHLPQHSPFTMKDIPLSRKTYEEQVSSIGML
jgi:hypothetical protein